MSYLNINNDVVFVSLDDSPFLSRAFLHYKKWEYNSAHENKHLSLIFHGSTLLSVGENKNKTHTIFNSFNRILPKTYYSIHSEIDAILNLFRKLRTKNPSNFPLNLTIVNFRNGFRFSAPCANCLALLQFLDFKDVYFTVDSDFPNIFGYIKIGELNE